MNLTEITLDLRSCLVMIVCMGLIFSSCTYSINLAHTQGSASDLIDENQKADADIKPNLSIPAI